MEFSTPAMEVREKRGPACDARWMAAIPLIRIPAMWDCDFSDMHVDHDTVGMLSDSTPALANCISTSLCSTKYCKITATTYTSEFTRQPCGL